MPKIANPTSISKISVALARSPFVCFNAAFRFSSYSSYKLVVCEHWWLPNMISVNVEAFQQGVRLPALYIMEIQVRVAIVVFG